jgi:hypothetical protein
VKINNIPGSNKQNCWCHTVTRVSINNSSYRSGQQSEVNGTFQFSVYEEVFMKNTSIVGKIEISMEKEA